MKEQKNNGRGIFYGVIGVATLVVAIIGATFAYFTATATNATNITGNMATVSFGLDVRKVTKADETKGGMIPMSNTMVEAAIKGTSSTTSKKDTDSDQQICVDDNGNAVCQIYKIAVSNNGTAGMFLDGYVSLTGGSNATASKTPEDTTGEMWKNLKAEGDTKTTMRWAQVFCTGTDNQLTSCTTKGKSTTRATGDKGISSDWDALGIDTATDAANTGAIGFARTQIKTDGITATGTYQANPYDIINTNFIRISDHKLASGADTDASVDKYTRTDDVTSALVFNQRIDPKGTGTPVDATATDSDSTKTYTDSQVYYIVVWLAETGKNQTAGNADVTTGGEGGTTGLSFFKGTVAFSSAQGSEVTATFSGYTAVKSDKA